MFDLFVAAKLTVGAEITAVGPSAKKRKTEEDCYTLTVKCYFFIDRFTGGLATVFVHKVKMPLLNLQSS